MVGGAVLTRGFSEFPQFPLTFCLLSTHVGCLLAIGFLGQKHLFVLLQYWCVSSHFPPFVARFRVSVFRVIATFSPCFGCICWRRLWL